MNPALLPILFGVQAPFTPANLAGLGMWHRADATLVSLGPDMPAANGDAIRRWTDLSGNGRHFDQATSGFRAVLASNGISGRPAATFDGVDDRYALGSGLNLFNNVPGATLVVIQKLASATSSAVQTALFVSSTGSSNSRAHVGARAANTYGAQGRRLDADSVATFLGGVTSANPTVLIGRLNYAGAIGDLFINGAKITTSNPFQTAGNSSATDSASIQMGALATSSLMGGAIAEVMAWPRALSDAELQQLHNLYLSPRYGFAKV